jgi:hypothetical protein
LLDKAFSIILRIIEISIFMAFLAGLAVDWRSGRRTRGLSEPLSANYLNQICKIKVVNGLAIPAVNLAACLLIVAIEGGEMEYLELSVPMSASGRFIELHQIGSLEKAQPLWAQCLRLRKSLEAVKEKLRMCNEPMWLFQFARKCRRQNRDFEKQLCELVDSLERARRLLEDRERAVCSKLQGVDPYLFEATHTLVGAKLLRNYANSLEAQPKSGGDVLRRNEIIRKNQALRSLELCKRFDLESIQMPEWWEKKLAGKPSWLAAYNNTTCRKLIHKMISVAKRDLRLP